MPASLGLEKKEIAAERRVHVEGKKVRGGCVPWRYAQTPAGAVAGGGCGRPVELLLIEGINSPGRWSFPAGSLDPCEEVSVCAVRETEEECG